MMTTKWEETVEGTGLTNTNVKLEAKRIPRSISLRESAFSILRLNEEEEVGAKGSNKRVVADKCYNGDADTAEDNFANRNETWFETISRKDLDANINQNMLSTDCYFSTNPGCSNMNSKKYLIVTDKAGYFKPLVKEFAYDEFGISTVPRFNFDAPIGCSPFLTEEAVRRRAMDKKRTTPPTTTPLTTRESIKTQSNSMNFYNTNINSNNLSPNSNTCNYASNVQSSPNVPNKRRRLSSPVNINTTSPILSPYLSPPNTTQPSTTSPSFSMYSQQHQPHIQISSNYVNINGVGLAALNGGGSGVGLMCSANNLRTSNNGAIASPHASITPVMLTSSGAQIQSAASPNLVCDCCVFDFDAEDNHKTDCIFYLERAQVSS